MILITGASGNLGSAVTNELLYRIEASQIAVMSRDTGKVDKFKKKGVQVRQGDYNDYESLVKAFSGIDKLYFVSGSDIVSRMKQHENVIKAAKEVGIKHIVYTSFQRKTNNKDSVIQFVAESHINTEELIKNSGIPYTILKHALYMEVLPLFIGEDVIEKQTIYLPANEGKVSFASRADMAQGAAIILSTKDHLGKTYEFGGEKSFTMEDVAQILTELSGKEITYISPKTDDFITTLSDAGVPKPAIDVTVGFSLGIAAGEFNQPTTTLKDLLGHELLSLSTYLEAEFVGN
ncbi:SDR family oxidoreductase [Mangrovimonas spongiae]|uniref:SDR family oxidoreductase n=1 Tax=Mangrovimonas spongiae TaxID=2494697 RepID=A0A3R9NLD6_9FLAO|nr:SDR family oxidoreductase [Mangrovimonas spongiae]RSK38602.1 SDR family oxidoreductase [Mangrovimonas spongiae]